MRTLALFTILVFLSSLEIGGQTVNAELARLRDHLNVPETTTIVASQLPTIPQASPLKVYLAMGLDMYVRARFVEKIEEWNKKDGSKLGMVEIVADILRADLILARYTIQENVTTSTNSVVVPGTVFDPGTNSVVTRPVTRSYSKGVVPAFNYMLTRTPQGLEIIWRQTGQADVGETQNSGRDLRDSFFKAMKLRGKKAN